MPSKTRNEFLEYLENSR